MQSENKCLNFILKNCFTINKKKYLHHAKLALRRANNPVVYERNCDETPAALQASRVPILIHM